MKKIKCAIIGPGNIGTDLLYKLQRSKVLEPVWMVGVDPTSEGLARAREHGLKTTDKGVDGMLEHVKADGVQIAFDATSAYVHKDNSDKLNKLGVMMIDLTPAAIGPYCVPPINLKEHAGKREMNVNMVTCGGPGDDPDGLRRVARAAGQAYAEIIATVSPASPWAPARARTSTSSPAPPRARSPRSVAARRRARRIIVINPAEPPMIMRDTIHCLTVDTPKQRPRIERIRARDMIKAEVQKYVPGYRLVNGPVFDGNRVTSFMQVEGLGDFLPKYAGNLDIMTASATRTAEMFAEEILAGRLTLEAA